jgi:hypothetical protein
MLLFALPALHAQPKSVWRAASSSELEAALPARALVERERIETEMRTASGIISARGKIIAGVVLITAGYSADGKYSHFLLIQSPITIGDVALSPGSYVLGWVRLEAGLMVHLYDAATGAERVNAIAHQMATGSRVEFGHQPKAQSSKLAGLSCHILWRIPALETQETIDRFGMKKYPPQIRNLT